MTISTEVAPAAKVFLAAPDVRIMELDTPLACPVFLGITFRAVAVTPPGEHYLVVGIDRPGLPPIVVHLGPDPTTIARRGLIMLAGLRAHGDLAADDQVVGLALLRWLAECWTILHDEIAEARS